MIAVNILSLSYIQKLLYYEMEFIAMYAVGIGQLLETGWRIVNSRSINAAESRPAWATQ